MKDGRRAEASTLRSILAAIDNAEAPPLAAGSASEPRRFEDGSAEIDRLILSADRLRTILLAEIEEREAAAAEMARLGQSDRAGALQVEIDVARRYLA